MHESYLTLSDDEIELLEKQTLRTAVQALQQYSREAKEIFENTFAESGQEVIILAEDITQYAFEVAELYPINRRFAGFIDYKRVRWMPTVYGLIPQVLLGDAKASTENNRDTLQQSQLPMDAEYISNGAVRKLSAGFPPHLEIIATNGTLRAITTSVFAHFYYEKLSSTVPPFRILNDIFVMCLPHQRLKARYNPNPTITFFGQGKHSSARGEKERIRVYFGKLRAMRPWRLQQLSYAPGSGGYTAPVWTDTSPTGEIDPQPFVFIGR